MAMPEYVVLRVAAGDLHCHPRTVLEGGLVLG